MSKERRYILILGGLLLLAGLVYRFLPEDGLGLQAGKAIQLSQKRVVKYKQLIEDNKSIDKRLKLAKNAEETLSQVFLDGATPALAAVDIQDTLSRIAQDTQVRIDRVDVRKHVKVKNEKIVRIPVRFNVVSTIRQLQNLIYAIEASKKILRVTDIHSSISGLEKPVMIRTSVTLEGFILEE